MIVVQMRLRPYRGAEDYRYIETWITDERAHAMWCANLIPYPVSECALQDFLERDAREWGGRPFVAVKEDKTPVGFFVYSVNRLRRSGFIKLIIVDDTMRGMGCGGRMVSLALQYAFKTTEVSYIELCVFDCNNIAKRCYEHAGFKETSREEAAFSYDGEMWGRCRMAAGDKEQANYIRLSGG